MKALNALDNDIAMIEYILFSLSHKVHRSFIISFLYYHNLMRSISE